MSHFCINNKGAPRSSGVASSQIGVTSTTAREPEKGGNKHVDGNTAGKSGETQNNDGSRACPVNAVHSTSCQLNFPLSDILHEAPFELEAMESSNLSSTDLQDKNFNSPPAASKMIDKKVFPGTTRMPIKKMKSFDSAEDSSEWDDRESTSVLPHFPAIDLLEEYQSSVIKTYFE